MDNHCGSLPLTTSHCQSGAGVVHGRAGVTVPHWSTVLTNGRTGLGGARPGQGVDYRKSTLARGSRWTMSLLMGSGTD